MWFDINITAALHLPSFGIGVVVGVFLLLMLTAVMAR